MITYQQAQNLNAIRSGIISYNASRRMKGLSCQLVPDKVMPDKVRIAYDAEGNYEGRLTEGQDCPSGCIVKLEYPTR